ncbi:MAG: hypothetical protein J5680_01415 [Neisseriaceae bacterium]|nr:hypothetical protein [Neisseriaceae bacterium]MBR5676094.1 hypothetical protein [Neisseriaceae bacterium]
MPTNNDDRRCFLSFRLPETIYRQAYGLFGGQGCPPYGVSGFLKTQTQTMVFDTKPLSANKIGTHPIL